MERGSSLLRRLGMFFLVMNIFLPFSIDAVFAQGEIEPATGSLAIHLAGDDGAPLYGGAFFVTDSAGNTQTVRDGDDGSSDGQTHAYNLAEGDASFVQVGGQDGYRYDANQRHSASIVADGSTPAYVTNYLVQDTDVDDDGVDDSVDSCLGAFNTGFDNDGNGVDNACDANDLSLIDGDSDGSTANLDCDDSNAAVNPAASEIADGIDNNCDGQVDEGLVIAIDNDSDTDTSIDTDTSTDTSTDTGAVIDNGTDTDADTDTDASTDTGIQLDTDVDGVADADDNCIKVENRDQLDTDSDKCTDRTHG